MRLSNITWRGAAIALFLIISACSPSSCPQWRMDSIDSSYPPVCSQKLFYRAEDSFNEVELEFVSGSYGIRGYLNIYSIPLGSKGCSSDTVAVVVKICDTVYNAQSSLLIGGQRVLLQEDMTTHIIDALNNGYEVVIQVEKYQSTIFPANFKKHYKSLCRI